MSDLDLAVLAVSSLVIGIGLFSRAIRASLVSAPLVALLVGIIFGPAALGTIDIGEWGNESVILEEAARLTLAIGLMGIALRLPQGDLRRRWRTLAVLLGLVMPIMWLVSSAIVYLIMGLPPLVALLIGAAITPTDPILARSIVQGGLAQRNIPERIRNTLLGESGLNDGLAYPFVLFVVAVLGGPLVSQTRLWFIDTVVWGVGGAVVFGALIGWAAAAVLRWSRRRHFMLRSSLFAYPIALSLLAPTLGRLVRADALLSAFFTGIVFVATAGPTERPQRQQVQEIQEMVDHFFSLPAFFLLGLALPWQQWLRLGWSVVGVAGCVLLLRRLPAVLLLQPLMHPEVRNPKEAAFAGWFGPMGVSALFYAMLAVRDTGIEEAWTAISLVICGSIVLHGVTGSLLTRRLGWVERHEVEE